MKKRKLILGIDGSRSARMQPTGVERYSTEIIRAILKSKSDFEIRLYSPRQIPAFPKKMQRVIPFPRFWTLCRLSLEMLLHKPGLLFVPAHVLPFFAPKQSFITVHDLAFEKYPQAYGFFQKKYLRWSTKRALKKAYGVIVPTEAVKKDCVDFYGADAGKIHVIHHGPLLLPKISKNELKETLKSYGLVEKAPLFLFIGRLESKKNLLTLLDAWSLVQKSYSSARLFLAGTYGHGFDAISQRMEAEDVSGSIVAPGYISEPEVAALLQQARALLLPSFDEGFGFTILQAFERNTAVICSKIPALEEVAGNAALYADPQEHRSFAKAMISIMKNPQLRKSLIQKGAKRRRDFSWTKAGKEMIRLFQSSNLK